MECGLKKILKNGNTTSLISFRLPRDFNGTDNLTIYPRLANNCSENAPKIELEGKDIQFKLKFVTEINITTSVPDSQIM